MKVREAVNRSSSRRRPAILALAAFLAAGTGHAASGSRLELAYHTDPPAGTYKGLTALTITPPFPDSVITVAVDGQTLARRLREPYRVDLDLGPDAVEHYISLHATKRDGSGAVDWTAVINPGLHPLGITVQRTGDRSIEATVTALPDDPVVEVSFYGAGGLIRTVTAAPYRTEIDSADAAGLIRVTARSRSGREVTDTMTGGTHIFAESYDVRTMTLLVSVLDDRGSAARNVAPSAFQVLDNGEHAKILDVGHTMEDPISVALVVDASASMLYNLPRATAAAEGFVSQTLRPQDRCAIFAIQSVPRREQALTGDVPAIHKALEGIRAEGETALYDALRSAVRELDGVEDRRGIIVLTDGEDNASFTSFDDVLHLAREAAIPIYIVAYNDDPELAKERDQLRYLAAQTGGFLTQASLDGLKAKYDQIDRDLRSKYEVRYQVTAAAKPNEWRDVRVVMKSPELTARTISGYFAP